MRIELTASAWEAEVLPLYDARSARLEQARARILCSSAATDNPEKFCNNRRGSVAQDDRRQRHSLRSNAK